VTGSVAGSFCFLWGWRLVWWAGIHRPAAAAACQSFFYDFYKKLTELSANNFRLLFCWPGWSLVTTGGIYVCVVHRELTPGGPGSGLRPGLKRFLYQLPL
jgi:hypothetical protein